MLKWAPVVLFLGGLFSHDTGLTFKLVTDLA